ncbi:TPA: hypothetical protein DDW35_01375, partial [Candidatus Sumerlaeota bacterium]|nr:hypothetical protein [Candidatus Sumerlaeota bacterium]
YKTIPSNAPTPPEHTIPNPAFVPAAPSSASIASEPTPEKADKTLLVDPNQRKVSKSLNEGSVWGWINESKIGGERFPMNLRRVRIGAHPLNCQIVLKGPGIRDLLAEFEWQGDNLKLTSHSNTMPVKVNGEPYRSTIVRSGDIITLANRDYILEIVGNPPPPVDHGLMRLSLISGCVLFLCVTFGLLGLHVFTARLPEVKDQTGEKRSSTVSDALLIEQQGMACLSSLQQRGSAGTALVRALQRLSEVEATVRKNPDDRDFVANLDTLTQTLNTSVNQLQAGGVNIENARVQWLGALEQGLTERQERLRVEHWNEVLKQCRQGQYEVSLNEIRQNRTVLSIQGENALKAIGRWNALGASLRSETPEAVFLSYHPYVKKKGGTALVDDWTTSATSMLDASIQLSKELAPLPDLSQALQSNTTLTSLTAQSNVLLLTVQILKAYRQGDTGAFNAMSQTWPSGIQYPDQIVKMNDQLKYFDDLKKRPGSKSFDDVKMLRSRFETLADLEAPVYGEIDKWLSEPRPIRTPPTPAEPVLVARDDPDAYTQLKTLLETYRNQPTPKIKEKIDDIAADYFVSIKRKGALDDATRNRLKDLRVIYRTVDPEQNLNTARQIDVLLQEKP